MDIQSLTDTQLRERTLDLARRLRAFQRSVDKDRNVVLNRTLPGWSREAQESGFRHTTEALQSQHAHVQKDFRDRFETEALALQKELMARLGIAVRRNGAKLPPLHYDAADYLEELAQRLPP